MQDSAIVWLIFAMFFWLFYNMNITHLTDHPHSLQSGNNYRQMAVEDK